MKKLDEVIEESRVQLKEGIADCRKRLDELEKDYKEADIDDLSIALISIPALCGELAGLEGAKELMEGKK